MYKQHLVVKGSKALRSQRALPLSSHSFVFCLFPFQQFSFYFYFYKIDTVRYMPIYVVLLLRYLATSLLQKITPEKKLPKAT